MEKDLYIDAAHPNETRIVLKSKNHIEEYEYENKNKLNIKNNIYLAKISRVEPSLQAAFLNFGRQRHGFLAFNDIQSDYYQIPHDDKEKLKKDEEKIRETLKEESTKNEENINENDVKNDKNNNDKNENVVSLNAQSNQQTEKIDNIKKKFGVRKYKIQEVIKPGQIVLIQVLKDERGLKGAALTTFISLAGKYTVLMPNTAKGGGISRKIYNSEDRRKIRNILNEINIPTSMGLIVRTAGSNKTKNEIEKDLDNTLNVWEEIKKKAIVSIAPSIIYEEGDIIKRAIRDIYDNETKNVIVEGNEGYIKAKNFMKMLMPQKVKLVKKYRGEIPLFHSSGIEKNLNSIFEATIKLNSGGYIVINPTEALISIDINSGKSTKEVNVEKTALNTNLEAAEEISRQIKIRDLAGLIIIDFIDMLNFHNRKAVERRLKEKLKDDRARIQFGRINNFGLMELSRQRLRESSVKWDIVLTTDSFSLKVIKKVEELAFSNKVKIINVTIPAKIKQYIEKNFNDEISFFRKKYNFIINFYTDSSFIIPEYKIELLNKNKKIVKKIDYVKIEDTNMQNNLINKKNQQKQNKKTKKKFIKKS
ncbi:MAG: ribonuclease E/G [Candidatus Pelagibacter sp. TMED64]|nr:ribonuclease E/G [Candidatus Pelagibacter sp.]OUU67593.1 MAG: ribonuclease E/G [Candidatus Pelagibacter sp. TMED64]|tara:strand:+ start:6856 stop:8625 length:1770 start_codon:yes stop_codon:yes gene_type:complete